MNPSSLIDCGLSVHPFTYLAAGLGRRGHEAQGGLHAEEEDSDGEEDLHGSEGVADCLWCCVDGWSQCV